MIKKFITLIKLQISKWAQFANREACRRQLGEFFLFCLPCPKHHATLRRLLRAHSAHPLLIGPSWTRFFNMFLRFGFWYFKTKKTILLRKNVKFFRGSAPRHRAYAAGVGASPQTPRLQRAAAPRGTSAASRQRQRKRCM